MGRLTSFPSWALLAGWIGVSALAVLVGRAIGARIHDDERGRGHQVGAALMPALGAMFAVLLAITLAGEAGYLKSAHEVVSDEGAAASQLAWAATSPGVDQQRIQAALEEYLRATRAGEWSGEAAARGDAATPVAIAELERVVRAEAARPTVGDPAAAELLGSIDRVTTGRRARLAEASRQLPELYIFALVVSGMALLVNAGSLVATGSRRLGLLVTGITLVVGLGIALLFALTAPWRGSLTVPGAPLDTVAKQLGSGYFSGP